MVPPSPRKYYVFREAANAVELASLLKLRYHGYLNSRGERLIKKNACEMDINEYDLYSRHYGFFQLEANKRPKPLGYMRTIERDITPSASLLWKIISHYPEMKTYLSGKTESMFPILKYCPNPQELKDFITERLQSGDSIVEGSRFVFSSAARSCGFPRFVLEAAMAITLYCQQHSYAIMACTVSHRRFYERFGFQAIKNYETCPHDDGLVSTVLINEKQTIPEDLQTKIQKMAKAYLETGGICYFPEAKNTFQLTTINMKPTIISRKSA